VALLPLILIGILEIFDFEMSYFRGVAEDKRTPLDLLIVVCRSTAGDTTPKPVSFVMSSKRQVKSSVMCSGILEEGTYMIGNIYIYNPFFGDTPMDS
jgi:hypothetical protein